MTINEIKPLLEKYRDENNYPDGNIQYETGHDNGFNLCLELFLPLVEAMECDFLSGSIHAKACRKCAALQDLIGKIKS